MDVGEPSELPWLLVVGGATKRGESKPARVEEEVGVVLDGAKA